MNQYFDNIVEFHHKFGHVIEPTQDDFYELDEETVAFRYKFKMEETIELHIGIYEKDPAEVLDALVDLAYVVIGTMYFSGHNGKIRFEPKFDERRPIETEFGRSNSNVHHFSNLIYLWLEYQSTGNKLMSIRILDDLLHQISMFVEWYNLPFNHAWQVVHKANMKKERATHAGESKRGSKLDVVKPKGWIAPNIDDVIKSYNL